MKQTNNSEALSVLGPREAMTARLRQIHDAGGDTDEGAIIVTFEGYISGSPEFFSTDFNDAFIFNGREQAERFIAEFADALLNPQVLDQP